MIVSGVEEALCEDSHMLWGVEGVSDRMALQRIAKRDRALNSECKNRARSEPGRTDTGATRDIRNPHRQPSWTLQDGGRNHEPGL